MFDDIKYWVKEGVRPSYAERIIIGVLNKHRIPYLREVSFENFKTPKKGYYRFDFYFPDKNLIIEYDGRKYHKEGNTKDTEKNLFCLKNGIRLIRLNYKHYYSLEKHLLKLLK